MLAEIAQIVATLPFWTNPIAISVIEPPEPGGLAIAINRICIEASYSFAFKHCADY